MTRKSPAIEVLEQSGERYPDLQAAQKAARKMIAVEMAGTLRALLNAGILINVNGRIIPAQEDTHAKEQKHTT
jgi:hypothetical protein